MNWYHTVHKLLWKLFPCLSHYLIWKIINIVSFFSAFVSSFSSSFLLFGTTRQTAKAYHCHPSNMCKFCHPGTKGIICMCMHVMMDTFCCQVFLVIGRKRCLSSFWGTFMFKDICQAQKCLINVLQRNCKN